MDKMPSFQLSADTRLLIQELRKCQVGATISYAQLSSAVGRDISGATGALHSARKRLLRDEQIVFDVVRGEALKRLSDVEIVGTSNSFARRMRRVAQRGVETLTAIGDFSALPRETQMRHTAAVSVFGVVAEMTKEKSIHKVEKAAENVRGELPISQTLEAFRK